jgi:hypothetical protein
MSNKNAMQIERVEFTKFLRTALPHEKELPVILRKVEANEHGVGFGLFAKGDIAPGEVVCFYAGSFVPHRAIGSKQNTHAILGGWTSDAGQVIDGRIYRACIPNVPHWAAGSMINSTLDANDTECCPPNVKVCVHPSEHFHYNVVQTIMNQPFGYAMAPVISILPIKKGEQLLYYYVFNRDFDEKDMSVALVNDVTEAPKQKKRIRLT